MKERKEIKSWLRTLKEVSTADDVTAERPLTTLTPAQMATILQHIFGDSVAIVDPALSLQASPLDSGPMQATGAVLYLQALRSLLPLTKPIAMLIAQSPSAMTRKSPLPSDSKSAQPAPGWKAMVIVPINYEPPAGQPVGNDQKPLVYYFDPQKNLPPNQVPVEVLIFCRVLMQGCKVPAQDNQGRPVMLTVEPVFKQLGFFHGCTAKCTQPQDSAWWALYFAIMAVSQAGVSFSQTEQLSFVQLQHTLTGWLSKPRVAPALESTDVSSAFISSSLASTSSASFTSSVSSESGIATSVIKDAPKGMSLPVESPKTFVAAAIPTTDENSGYDAQKTLSPTSTTPEKPTPLLSPEQTSTSLDTQTTTHTPAEIQINRQESKIPAKPTLTENQLKQSRRATEAKKESRKKKVQEEKQADETKENKEPNAQKNEKEEKQTAFLNATPYQGPAYTLPTIAGILKAYRIAITPEDKLSRDSSDEFALTAYVATSLTDTVFLQDLLRYWQTHQGRLENRRVAYVFSTAQAQMGQRQLLGLVIQYTVPNTLLASKLWQTHEAGQLSTPMLLEQTALTQAAPKFYERMQVMVLGVSAQSSLIAQLKTPLEKVGRGEVILNFKAISFDTAYTVVLTEDILGMLQHGQTCEVKPAVAAAHHQARCVQAMFKRWKHLEEQNAQLHQVLMITLRAVLIMATLQTQRRTGYQLGDGSISSLRLLKARDEAVKKHLYTQRATNHTALLQGLPLNVLAALITQDDTENLKTLNQYKTELRREVHQWEMDLAGRIQQQRLTPCDRLAQAWHFIYQASFLGFGGELCRLLGLSLSSEGAFDAKEEKAKASAKQLAKKEARFISQAVKKITRSESLAAGSETAICAFLGTEPVSRSLSILGTLMGATIQIALGPYVFAQMLGTAAMTTYAFQTLESNQLDEATAILKESTVSLSTLHRSSVLLWHGAEALITGSGVPFVAATGAVAGSLTAATIAQRWSPGLFHQKREQPTEGMQWWELLVRQAGAILGERGMMRLWMMAISIQQRIVQRDTAMALLSYAASQRPGLQQWQIQGADFRHPGTWFNQDNPLMFSWITPSGVTHHVECNIQGLPILTPTGVTGLACGGDVPAEELSSTLGLPKP